MAINVRWSWFLPLFYFLLYPPPLPWLVCCDDLLFYFCRILNCNGWSPARVVKTWAGRSCYPLSSSILWVADVTGIVPSFNVLSIYSLGVLIAGSMCFRSLSAPPVTFRWRLTPCWTLDVLIARRNLISFGADLWWAVDHPPHKTIHSNGWSPDSTKLNWNYH